MHSEYAEIKDEIINIRRQIHMHPELGYEEVKTAVLICSVLGKYGISYKSGIAKTGIVATIGKKEDKVLLIRADMDALPIAEKTNLPFASKSKGIMHACGHDIHIASALACAILLKKHEHLLQGSVKIVFQPAEESIGGAMPMIEEGILDMPKVTCAIGGHISPELEVGKIKIKDGALMASPDDFAIKFTGKSTHGAEPQNGISPILPAAEMVLRCKQIEKELSKGTHNVLSVCTVSANGSVNIIPEDAVILGTFRSFDDVSRNRACELIRTNAEEISKKHGTVVEYKYNFLYPPVINDPAVTTAIIDAANSVIGSENVIVMSKPLMTGEDFSYFGRYVPSSFFWYGGKSNIGAPLHSAEFVANEDAIEVCTKIFLEFAKNYLESK